MSIIQHSTARHKGGFTLIELSIVLVIIGLIIGGVLVGRDLIKAAQVRGTVKQIEQYNAAANTFLTKYNCLPGDCANASVFGLGGLTPNGNGDGHIGQSSSCVLVADDPNSCGTTNASWEEMINFWVHLKSAKLISDNFTISDTGSIAYSGPGVNYPAAKVGAGGFWVVDDSFQVGGFWPDGPLRYGRAMFWLTRDIYYPGSEGGIITPTDAFAIDTKLDDGFPITGIVRATADFAGQLAGEEASKGAAGSANCINSTPTPNAYNVTNNSTSLCGLAISAAF